MRRRVATGALLGAVAALAIVPALREGRPHPTPARQDGSTAGAAAVPSTPTEELMKDGLDLLYAKKDPAAAAALFRRVLRINPTHYGATFQLAVALDQTGDSAEARSLWAMVLVMAQKYDDPTTSRKARARLFPPRP